MPIISYTDSKTYSGRLVIIVIYLLLFLGGLTMIYPFMVMLTGSTSNAFDYERRSALPRYVWSREDRFLRALCAFFPPSHRASLRQLRAYYPDLPTDWQIWSQIGDDTAHSDGWARQELSRLNRPAERQAMETAARDYRDFMATWDLRETILAYDPRYIAPFLRARYGTLDRFNAAWEVSIDDFSKVNAPEWSGEPIDQPGYTPIVDTRYTDFLAFRQAYRDNRYTSYLSGQPAGFLRPAALRFLWEDYAAAHMPTIHMPPPQLPFPVPPDASPAMRTVWFDFLKTNFPLRHIEITMTAAQRANFRRFLIGRFRSLTYLNRVLERSPANAAHSWDDIKLTPTVPEGSLAKVWMDFVRTGVPVPQWIIRNTLPEQAFQKFALQRHGNLSTINAAYGLKLAQLQQLKIPYGEAFLITFGNREGAFALDQTTANYRTVADYLFQRESAVRNTIILVALAMLITLTVNPLAGYALSRFRLRASEQIIVFCLATMAFPAAVTAIPGFLLLRDLGLLNTFAALVLPGAANGMSIFLLKGFFDSLPQELYEAATIDGAPEWRIFATISIPLVKPILAVSLLNAFIATYNAWEWAIVVCQDPKMWTVAVWTYQFSQTVGSQPATVMAAFIISSIPVLIVFLSCQRIILRGIILPQMK